MYNKNVLFLIAIETKQTKPLHWIELNKKQIEMDGHKKKQENSKYIESRNMHKESNDVSK